MLGKVKKGILKIYKEYCWLYIARWAFRLSIFLLLMPEAICGVNIIEFKKEIIIKGLY